MSKPDYRKLREKILRDAQVRMDLLAKLALERKRMELAKLDVELSRVRLHEDDVELCIKEQIEYEISSLSAQRDRSSNMGERAELKAAIAHLSEILAQIKSSKRPKPPESGMSVPAVPPKGPRPKLGGAAARLDFDTLTPRA